MPFVDLICLANSYKEGGRCIAGLRTDGGGWLRPVPAGGCRVLAPKHYGLGESGEPRTLDVIRVGLLGPEPIPYQPENWVMDATPWKLLRRPAGEDLAPVLAGRLQRGSALFRSTVRWIPGAALRNSPAPESLALVRPAEIRWVSHFSMSQCRLKARAVFRLGTIWYDLPLTDPLYTSALKNLPEGDHRQEEIGIPAGRGVLLTISLGEPHEDGNCYKLAAAVVPVPQGWERYFDMQAREARA